MSLLKLDGHLLHALLEDRLPGGMGDMHARWPAYDRAGEEPNVPPHRSTVNRWSRGLMPRTSDDLMRLCGILDVDPMCLLKLPDNDSETTMESMATIYLHGRWEPAALRFLEEFLGRRPQWPPPELALRYFGRKWFCREFVHEATTRTNYYARANIVASPRMSRGGPFVYHVAFRHATLFGKRWLQYGMVLRYGKRVSLRHINGHTDMYDAEDVQAPTRIETWFGPSPAVFRIASLHAFDLYLDQATNAELSAVRFVG